MASFFLKTGEFWYLFVRNEIFIIPPDILYQNAEDRLSIIFEPFSGSNHIFKDFCLQSMLGAIMSWKFKQLIHEFTEGQTEHLWSLQAAQTTAWFNLGTKAKMAWLRAFVIGVPSPQAMRLRTNAACLLICGV